MKFTRNPSYDNLLKERSYNGPMAASAVDLLASTADSINLDKFYKEIIKKERQEFERILKSKEMITRNDVEMKMRKQLLQAEKKYQKCADLEK